MLASEALTHHVHILELNGRSYRLSHSLAVTRGLSKTGD